MADCHTTEPHFAKGFCRKCYDKNYATINREKINKKSREWSKENEISRKSARLKYMYNIDFETLNLTKTKIKNAKSLFDDYIDRNFDINISTYLLKGALISEFFFRFRSFVNYCKKNNLFYIIDLDGFDFHSLLNDGFSEDQLEKIQSAYNDYNTVHKIRR